MNLPNQGSLKNHFLKEFFKEPIIVPQKKKVRQSVMVLLRTTKPFKEPFKNLYFLCRLRSAWKVKIVKKAFKAETPAPVLCFLWSACRGVETGFPRTTRTFDESRRKRLTAYLKLNRLNMCFWHVLFHSPTHREAGETHNTKEDVEGPEPNPSAPRLPFD